MTRAQLQRVTAVLKLLPRLPKRIGTPEIAAKLQRAGYAVPDRQLQKYMVQICDALPVSCEEGKPNRYGWHSDAAPFEAAALEPAGAMLLALVEPTLRAILPPRLAEHFEAIFRQARETAVQGGHGRLTTHVRALPEALQRLRPLPQPKHLDVLMSSLKLGLRVRASYKKRRAKRATSYLLGPVGLVSVGPVLMLLANKVGEVGVRHFEVQRFHAVKLLDEPTVGIDDFDIDAHIAAGEVAFPIGDTWLDLEFEVGDLFADEVQDGPLAAGQRTEPAGERLRVEARVRDTWALQRFILGLGAQAVV